MLCHVLGGMSWDFRVCCTLVPHPQFLLAGGWPWPRRPSSPLSWRVSSSSFSFSLLFPFTGLALLSRIYCLQLGTALVCMNYIIHLTFTSGLCSTVVSNPSNSFLIIRLKKKKKKKISTSQLRSRNLWYLYQGAGTFLFLKLSRWL